MAEQNINFDSLVSQIKKNQSLTDQSLPIRQTLSAQFKGVAFISKYELNIPSKERMAEFLRKENEGLNKEDNV